MLTCQGFVRRLSEIATGQRPQKDRQKYLLAVSTDSLHCLALAISLAKRIKRWNTHAYSAYTKPRSQVGALEEVDTILLNDNNDMLCHDYICRVSNVVRVCVARRFPDRIVWWRSQLLTDVDSQADLSPCLHKTGKIDRPIGNSRS